MTCAVCGFYRCACSGATTVTAAGGSQAEALERADAYVARRGYRGQMIGTRRRRTRVGMLGYEAWDFRYLVSAGMRFYNEAVLVNSIGSLPIRIGRQFEAGRKLGRTHQNVLVFAKGTPERGWSYARQAPPAPQLDLWGDVA